MSDNHVFHHIIHMWNNRIAPLATLTSEEKKLVRRLAKEPKFQWNKNADVRIFEASISGIDVSLKVAVVSDYHPRDVILFYAFRYDGKQAIFLSSRKRASQQRTYEAVIADDDIDDVLSLIRLGV